MDVGLNFRAKRPREGSTDTGIAESVQIKFKRLLERNQAPQITTAVETQAELKSSVLKLIDDNLSFEGILKESEDTCCVHEQCDLNQEKHDLESLSALTVGSCVDLLKCQATRASCPLDLLAAESLGTRLVTLCSSTSDQLLTKSQQESVLCIVRVIKQMLSEQCFNRVYFTKHLTSKGPSLPLEVVWMLHKDCIVSFDTYLACCLQHSETVQLMSGALTALCSCIISNEKQEHILSVLLGRLVTFSFLENKAKEGPNNRLEKISQEILDITVEKSDFLACEKTKDASSNNEEPDSICVLEIVRRLNDIPWTTIRKFFTRQLNVLFTKQTGADTLGFFHVFCNQKKLKFSALSKTTRTVFQQFLLVFDPLTVLEFLKNALFKDQVNIEGILSFLSTFVVLVKEAAAMIEGYVKDLLNESLNTNDSRSLSVAFLVIRQISQEGGHVYQPYITWFHYTFGDQGSVKLTIKKSVQFFMKFLSDLVPYEPAEYLKVHVLKAPHVPSKFRDLVTDYVSLAKTRLMDLKEPVELMAMYVDSSGSSGTEAKSEQTKQLEQASADVEKVLESYEKTGKVPSTVMEASIFRKPYFIGRFLPALLTPRKLPDVPDTRSQLIDVLSKAGKIPKNMLSTYQSACEKITTEQIEVNSSDDEGALSGIEKLVSSLGKLTRLIVESLKSTDISKESGGLGAAPFSFALRGLLQGDPGDTTSVASKDMTNPLPRTPTPSNLAEYRICCEILNDVAKRILHLGRISSQLSIISATIQSITKTSSEMLAANQLVELDVTSLDKTSPEPIMDTLLEAFSHTYSEVSKCTDSLDYGKRYYWVADFVAMVVSVTLHKSLYCHLWIKTCCEGVSLKKEATLGLAVFLCHLCTNQSNMLPILLKGIVLPVEKNLQDDFTFCSFVDVLCEFIPVCTSRWMEFFLRFSCSYVEHALEVFGMNVTELKTSVGRHITYVSPVMLKKMFYLFHRLNVYEETCFYKPALPADVVCVVSKLASLQQFQQLKGKREKLAFSDWCRLELGVSATNDFLPDTDRRIYHQYTVLDHYLPLGSLEGGCDSCARKACSVIFHALLDSANRSPQEQHNLDVSQNDMINLIQELLPLLSQKTKDAASDESREAPWLLEQLDSRLREIQSKLEKSNSKTSRNYELLRASEITSFMKVVMRLPSFLLFTDLLDPVPDVYSVKRVVTFINSNLRPYLSDGCRLPFDVTLHILKGLLNYSRGGLSKSRTLTGSQLLSEFFTYCPLLLVSVQHFWKQLRPLAATQCDFTRGPLEQAQLLLSWKNRFETTQNVSLRELEGLDVCVVASCIAASLRVLNSHLLALFVEESKSPTGFITKLAACLFDCIMAEFSQMILHGREIGENAVLRNFALKLLKCFPRTLLIFKVGEDCEFKDALDRLRSLILKDQLLRLYPAVFFSFFSNLTKEALREVTSFRGFLEVTLCMYNSFVYLRKECLDGVVNKTAVCSPLHLDFCRQVSVFVRDTVSSSSAENLRSLSKDFISSCTSELRQLLQSRMSKFQER